MFSLFYICTSHTMGELGLPYLYLFKITLFANSLPCMDISVGSDTLCWAPRVYGCPPCFIQPLTANMRPLLL